MRKAFYALSEPRFKSQSSPPGRLPGRIHGDEPSPHRLAVILGPILGGLPGRPSGPSEKK